MNITPEDLKTKEKNVYISARWIGVTWYLEDGKTMDVSCPICDYEAKRINEDQLKDYMDKLRTKYRRYPTV